MPLNAYPAAGTPAYTTRYTSRDPNDPAYMTAAVRSMEPAWAPVDVCLSGTAGLRANARALIPIEPREDEDAYNRRIFHATMPPFLLRLASQAAGIILRKGIELTHPNDSAQSYWDEWIQDVTGDGTTLNEYARRQLITAILYGHSSTLVDYDGASDPRTLAEERLLNRKPYLVPVHPRQVLGWRTADESAFSELAQVRILETVVLPKGDFGEELVHQVRVMEPGRYTLYRGTPVDSALAANLPLNVDWQQYASEQTSLDRIPLVTVYSNRLGNLLSSPPLLEVAQLNIAYAQRFCDYHHAIHVGASPILILRGFDAENDAPLGVSVNTALALPPDGGGEYIQPTSDAFDAQLKCLEALESQISRLGINTLTQQNITNAAADAKRMDRIDSDSIMAVIAGDLERTIEQVFALASEYVGVEPPTVTIPRDYENRLIDGNQITAYLQLFMQGAISQETLLTILQQGEVLPASVDIAEEITATRDMLEQQRAMDALGAGGTDLAFQGGGGGTNAGQGTSPNSQTLPTPLRSGLHG